MDYWDTNRSLQIGQLRKKMLWWFKCDYRPERNWVRLRAADWSRSYYLALSSLQRGREGGRERGEDSMEGEREGKRKRGKERVREGGKEQGREGEGTKEWGNKGGSEEGRQREIEIINSQLIFNWKVVFDNDHWIASLRPFSSASKGRHFFGRAQKPKKHHPSWGANVSFYRFAAPTHRQRCDHQVALGLVSTIHVIDHVNQRMSNLSQRLPYQFEPDKHSSPQSQVWGVETRKKTKTINESNIPWSSSAIIFVRCLCVCGHYWSPTLMAAPFMHRIP